MSQVGKQRFAKALTLALSGAAMWACYKYGYPFAEQQSNNFKLRYAEETCRNTCGGGTPDDNASMRDRGFSETKIQEVQNCFNACPELVQFRQDHPDQH